MLSGKLYNQMLRQQFYIKQYVTSAQLLQLFSTPITMVAANPGFFYMVNFLHLVKEAGTAYTLNASTNLFLKFTTSAAVHIAVSPANFLDQAPQLTSFAQGPSNQLTSFYTTFDGLFIQAITGAALQLTNNVANFTNGTGGLFVTMMYSQWPAVISFS